MGTVRISKRGDRAWEYVRFDDRAWKERDSRLTQLRRDNTGLQGRDRVLEWAEKHEVEGEGVFGQYVGDVEDIGEERIVLDALAALLALLALLTLDILLLVDNVGLTNMCTRLEVCLT